MNAFVQKQELNIVLEIHTNIGFLLQNSFP